MKIRVPHGSATPIDLRHLPDEELLRWLRMLSEQLQVYKELVRKGKTEVRRRGLDERREPPREERRFFGVF